MKLLLIEENAGLRRLRLLHSSGADLCECIEGTAAVSLCVLEQPDWAVVDLNLARANGIHVLEQIHAACPQTRLIVIADEDSARLRARAQAAGAGDYVLKENLAALPQIVTTTNQPCI